MEFLHGMNLPLSSGSSDNNMDGFGGYGTPLQYSCLENPMEGGAWWAAIHGIAKGSPRDR